MGDIKRKRKLYKRPKKPFDKPRIEEENTIKDKFGLKNKKEIWKAEAEISKIRRRAKNLISKSEEEKQKFFIKLNKIGLNVKDISDVLALTKEDYLSRRLETFVFKKGLANSPRQARQLIAHKHVLVNGKVVNSPSFIVTKELEDKLQLKIKKGKAKKKEVVKENIEELEETEDKSTEETMEKGE